MMCVSSTTSTEWGAAGRSPVTQQMPSLFSWGKGGCSKSHIWLVEKSVLLLCCAPGLLGNDREGLWFDSSVP